MPSKARGAQHHRTLHISNGRMLCTWQRLWRGQFGVAARGVDAADLDEASHEHDEGDAHQQHCPPVSLDDTEALSMCSW